MMKRLVPALLVLLLFAAISQAAKCGYDSCPDSESWIGQRADTKVIHLVAHTHDDVGWLKTVDQYYYGTKSYIQRASVRLIIDSVVSALASHPHRKFTYVEMEFFSKWWALQQNETRALVHRLVRDGQLHFVLAGVSMADEAAVNYDDSINQLTWGANYLKVTSTRSLILT
ncbi:hypothetical protein Ciccas_002755 [Cichlidogyrus casuarinus]|uniref:Glycoside hydrolase family 38 N-terminal domain-containing protein n=1 Tax=Cichlidogyrus casuarinus TaxID=1844966 RepID=A0ABD2QIL9_9PLAT